ncbi:MAG: phospholipase D-like domain-containing protein [Phycisphaerae bacterium]|jgi:V8-like Glu-specific endopeptidase
MNIDDFQLKATLQRFNERRQARDRNERLIRARRFLEVDRPERVEKFLTRQGFSPRDRETMLRHKGRGTPLASEAVAGLSEPFALERVLGTNDLMGVAFLSSGLRAARTVGRIWIGVAAGRPQGYGTGFMVSPRLLLTNNHVLGDRELARKSLVEFDYELGDDGRIRASTCFAFDPATFHLTDRALDYALVAVQPAPLNGNTQLAEIGWNRLIEEQGKAIAAQWLNIVQHPNAEPKQLVLRENQLIDVLEQFLHYRSDTSPGSSGSPVYNDRWEVVALHHSGVPDRTAAGDLKAIDGQVWRPEMGEQRVKWIANEGARISRVVAHLRQQAMSAAELRLFEEIFTDPPTPTAPDERQPVPPGPGVASDVSVGADGSATWTVPLTVTVRVGGAAGPPAGPGGAPLPGSPRRGPDGPDSGGGDGPAELLAAAKRELGQRADVLNVRLGYVFKNGWITKDRAVVVTVARRRAPAELREAGISPLPDRFRDLPVEVTNPSVEDLVRMARGPAAVEAAFADADVRTEEITYTPPDGLLSPVSGRMRVVAHVSPEEGWSQLSKFLRATKKRLVIGMYDFGAPHVVDAVETCGRKTRFQKLTLVMQAGESVGSGTKKDDLKDAEVVEQFRDALHSKFENAWVKIGSVNGWVASSYHIKVIVRDQNAFWLSSGNLQSSNQPKSNGSMKTSALRKYNREWHAIVEHAGLAKVYERFLLHDYENNRHFQPRESLELAGVDNLPDLLLPASFFEPDAEERAASLKLFQPYDRTRVFRVQPLLTPDNYHEHALELVRSAQEELLIQNQTFNAPRESHESLRELLSAILERQRAGVQVRIIFRLLFASKARANLEALQDLGFDMDSIRVQKNCHTKGIIADGQRVMLGSQNLSNQGVSVNRDASLLFDDAELAGHFKGIFEHDWAGLARQNIGHEDLPIEWATAETATPKGSVRLTWKDYMEMC